MVKNVVKNASRPDPAMSLPIQDGKRFAFQLGWIVTLIEGLCKCFQRGKAAQILRGNRQGKSPKVFCRITTALPKEMSFHVRGTAILIAALLIIRVTAPVMGIHI